MKRHFKYSNGYINVDENNVYITSTGNWSETKILTEKPFGKSMYDDGKYFGFYQVLGFIILLLVSIFSNDTTWYIKGGLILLCGLLFYKTKDYFTPELGERFLIPKIKILNINQTKKQLIIEFKSLDNKNDFIKLNGIIEIDELRNNLRPVTNDNLM